MVKWIRDGRARHVWRLLAGAALAAAVVLLIASCGSGKNSSSNSDKSAGGSIVQSSSDRFSYARARFREMCAGCHTLSNAGARGPRFNLDAAGSTPKELARDIIKNGGPGMPAWNGVLSRREYEELVAYVVLTQRNVGPENGWRWQIKLREEGDRVPPTLSLP